MSNPKDLVYTDKGELYMPDVEIGNASPLHTYVPLRGHAYVMAVMKGGECIGWIDTLTIGYDSAAAWLESGNG